MKVCEVCGIEIYTKDGENRCQRCEYISGIPAVKKPLKASRKEREQVMRGCGLVKVKGALGGTYWE